MNLEEVENILKTLVERHPDLDEEMLKTLLSSGGFEEKVINDAVLLYRKSNLVVSKPVEDIKEIKENKEDLVKNEEKENDSGEEVSNLEKKIQEQAENQKEKNEIVDNLYTNDSQKKVPFEGELMPSLPKEIRDEARKAIKEIHYQFENHILFSIACLVFIILLAIVVYMFANGRL